MRLEAIAPSVQLVRYGALLLVRENAVFPDRCLLTNQATSSRLPVSFSWMIRSPRDQRRVSHQSTIVILAVVAGIFLMRTLAPGLPLMLGFALYLPYFIYLNRSQRIHLKLPICTEELSRYRRTLLHYLTAFAAIAAIYPLAGIFNNYWWLLIGALAHSQYLFFLLVRRKLFRATESAEGFVALQGVCADYLQTVPHVYAPNLHLLIDPVKAR
jgi:hypothetical protein